jgi:hypothetical protein
MNKHTSGLNIAYWNINGLKSKERDKSDDEEFRTFTCSKDIVGIGETHLSKNKLFSFNEYTVKSIYRPRPAKACRDYGGISVLIKKRLQKGVVLIKQKEYHYLWVKVLKEFIHREKDLYICFTHIPHESSSYFGKINYDILNNLHMDIKNNCRNGDVILLGDFNGRVGNVSDWIAYDSDDYLPLHANYIPDKHIVSRNNHDNVVNDRGREIIDLCLASKIRILNGRTLGDLQGKYTYYNNGVSTIDYCLAHENIINDVCYFKVNDIIRGLSDHCSISVTVKAKIAESKHSIVQGIKTHKLPQKFKWDDKAHVAYCKAFNLPLIQKEVTLFLNNEQACITEDVVKRCTDIMVKTGKISLLQRKCVKRKNRGESKKWYDNELLNCRRELRKLGRTVGKGASSRKDIEDLRCAMKIYRHKCKSKYEQYRARLLSEVENIRSNKSKEAWKTLSKLKNDVESNDKENSIEPDSWYIHYRDLNKLKHKYYDLSKEYDKDIERLKSINTEVSETLNGIITPEEVIKSINEVKWGKSSGTDLILNDMLKAIKTQIEPMITKLFNIVLKQGKYPSQWGEGIITSLYKSGEQDDTNNYRGITITSCLGKLYNRIMNSRLYEYRQENKQGCREQIAYQKDSRTTDHIFVLQTLIDKYIKHKKPLFVCFVDMKKAFDSVLHQSILVKLLKAGINGNFYSIIQDMYKNTKLSAKVSSLDRTEYFKSEVGIRQGDNLSPNLFKIIMDELPHDLKSNTQCVPVTLNNKQVYLLMYADDIALFSETPQGLQTAIDITKEYGEKQGLEMNIKKTKVMCFTKKGIKSKHVFNLDGIDLEEVREYKYLGIHITSNGSLENVRSHLHDVAIKAMFKMSRYISNFHLSVKTCLHLFDSLISPILLYGCEISNIFNITKAIKEKEYRYLENIFAWQQEKLHLKFCRYTLGVNNKTANMAVLGELGRYPLFIKAAKQILKFHIRVRELSDNTLTKDAYLEMSEGGLNCTWISCIKFLLKKGGISNTEEDYSVNAVEQKLRSEFREFWKEKMFNDVRQGNQKNKLRTYREFKTIYEMEPYLEKIKEVKYRRALTKLRVSNHSLMIEKGRHQHLKVEQRLCTECKVVGDEEHFLTNCKLNETNREVLYFKIKEICKNFSSLNSKDKMVYMMSITDEEALKHIGKFVYDSFIIVG